MNNLQIISFSFAILFVISVSLSIGLMFYIGKTRIKEIDKAVLGYVVPHDSIFYLMIRIPNYASGFLWKWSAKRNGLEGKIEGFDKKFRWPFIASFILVIFGMSCAVFGVLFDKYFNII